MHADLTGKVHIEPYHELLSKPYVKSVQARSLKNPPPDLVEKTTAFVEELRDIQRQSQDASSDFFSSMFREKIKKVFFTDKIAAGCVPHYYHHVKILNTDPFESKLDFLKALNTQHPTCMYPAYSLTHTVMIRSLIKEDVKR